jgi:hypothetical protein
MIITKDRTSKKILIVQLVSNGDCLYVTAIARQIKKDYPGCELTWIISDSCSLILLNNRHVDVVEIWPVKNVREAMTTRWYELNEKLSSNDAAVKYDLIFRTQFFPDNIQFYDGTIRSTLFRAYPHRIEDVTPHLQLTDQEVLNVIEFEKKHKLHTYSKVVMFECSPGSGQSFITPEFAFKICLQLLEFFDDMIVVLSTHLHLNIQHRRVVVANSISFRENAELAKHCNFFIGSSSGITWLLTSDWIHKPIPSIQLLKKSKGISFASVKYDLEYWGLDHSHIVEIFTPDINRIVNCVRLYYTKGMPACISKFNQVIKPDPFHIKDYFNILAKRKSPSLLINLFKNFIERNGISLKFLFAVIYIFLQGIARMPYVLLMKNKGAGKFKLF